MKVVLASCDTSEYCQTFSMYTIRERSEHFISFFVVSPTLTQKLKK